MQRERVYNCIRRFRRERGLTQREVTAILGVRSSSMVSRWERGIAQPDTMNALKLAALYRTTVDNLFWNIRLKMSDEISGRERAIVGNRFDKMPK